MSEKLAALYANRFDDADRAWKQEVWRVLWTRVFSRWVGDADTLVDLGAGYCEFINHALARRRIAVDLNPDTADSAAPGVEVRRASADDLGFLQRSEVDVVFTSNFLEHLPTKDVVARVVDETARVLKPGGRFILVGPNIRFCARRYWDYFDHHVPLSHASVCELLALHGFEIVHVEPRFLPFTVKGTRLRWTWLVNLYLSLRPFSSVLFGKQFFIVGRRARARGAAAP